MLSQMMDMILSGQFPVAKGRDNALAPYDSKRDLLTVVQGCLLWGNQVIVPPILRPQVPQELHAGHTGVVKMKAMARSYVWWPGMDAQSEQQAKACHSCQRNQKSPSPSPLHSWPWPETPWQRIHVNFAGPLEGHMFLVVVDAHLKWPEVQRMDSITTLKTIQALRSLFSLHGLPEVLVSDNGPQFTLSEFGLLDSSAI